MHICNSLHSVTSGRGQQCCYDENGYLITGPPSGGTVDLWSAEISPSRHYQSDIEPFILCCKGQFQTCGLYYERRPSDNGSRFNPPPCGKLSVFLEESFVSYGTYNYVRVICLPINHI